MPVAVVSRDVPFSEVILGPITVVVTGVGSVAKPLLVAFTV
jgi:hypothetical protein